jgi:hypothetical protein
MPNDTIVLLNNDSESTKTKVSLDMAEKGAVKGPGSQTVQMMLGSGEEGAGAEHVRHHRKNLPEIHTIAKVFRVGGECPTRLILPMQGK